MIFQKRNDEDFFLKLFVIVISTKRMPILLLLCPI